MPDAHTDFVIQISASAGASPVPGAAPESADESQLIRELQRSLQPGGEIVLIIGACIARTSILWLSEIGQESSFRAGVRFRSISVQADKDCLEYPFADQEDCNSLERLQMVRGRDSPYAGSK